MSLHPPDRTPVNLQTLATTRSRGLVIGVDIGGTNLRLALADLTGTIVGRWSCSTLGIRDPLEIVRLTCHGTNTLLAESGSSRSDLCAIAAGAPGITDSDRGIVLVTSYLMGWTDVALRDLLEQELGVPAFVDNDVNMAAYGEHAAGSAQGLNDFVFLAIGTGVGAGILLNGELYRGAGWIAGEIGYMLVPGVSVTPVDGDSPGALEEIVGGHGIQSHWQSIWTVDGASIAKDATATEIFDAALAHDPLAQTVLERVSGLLAYAIYNISLVLNCPVFVLGGSVGLHPALAGEISATLRELNTRVQPEIVASRLGVDAQIVGAIFRAMKVAHDLCPATPKRDPR